MHGLHSCHNLSTVYPTQLRCPPTCPQIAPQIWMFLPLGAVGGPFALPNCYLKMSTDQTLCASSTPATSCPSYTPHNFVAPQIALQICILITYSYKTIRVISVSTTTLVFFVFPRLLHMHLIERLKSLSRPLVSHYYYLRFSAEHLL